MYDFYKDNKKDESSCTSGIWQVIGFKEFLPWLENNQVDEKQFNEGVERMKLELDSTLNIKLNGLKSH